MELLNSFRGLAESNLQASVWNWSTQAFVKGRCMSSLRKHWVVGQSHALRNGAIISAALVLCNGPDAEVSDGGLVVSVEAAWIGENPGVAAAEGVLWRPTQAPLMPEVMR
jgi:hypothetical protein